MAENAVVAADEWGVIERLLPAGWEDAARKHGAFRRARYMSEPGALLRLLLFHAVTDFGLRQTVAQARASGIASMSQVALLKRLRTSGDWLAWLAENLCRDFRQRARVPEGMRLRAVDSTTVQGPASKGTEWRVHYAVDLMTLNCDWHELTDAGGGEGLGRTPVQKGDVLLGDRGYLHAAGIRSVTGAGGHVVLRMRWNHCPMRGSRKQPFHVIRRLVRLRAGKIGEWAVTLPGATAGAPEIHGRVVAIRLPRPIAELALRRLQRRASKKGERLDPRTLEAAKYVVVFTTLPADLLDAGGVLELYRCRWQIELAFKRLKQLLKLGRLPHQEPRAARSWILAKLVVALLLESLYRNASAFSPWGYDLPTKPPANRVVA